MEYDPALLHDMVFPFGLVIPSYLVLACSASAFSAGRTWTAGTLPFCCHLRQHRLLWASPHVRHLGDGSLVYSMPVFVASQPAGAGPTAFTFMGGPSRFPVKRSCSASAHPGSFPLRLPLFFAGDPPALLVVGNTIGYLADLNTPWPCWLSALRMAAADLPATFRNTWLYLGSSSSWWWLLS